jgi:hypothetical protein
MSKELKGINRNILELYKQDPNVVNFDKLLLTKYWTQFDGWDKNRSLLENMLYVTPAGSITRGRRYLHQNGYIIYSKDVSERREKEYKRNLEEHSTFIERFKKIFK